MHLSFAGEDDVAGDGDVEERRLTSRGEHFLKTLFVLTWCRIAKTRVSETCSPDHRCTQPLGMESDEDTPTMSNKIAQSFTVLIVVFG